MIRGEGVKATNGPLSSADPRSSSSLIPMLIGGLVLTVVGLLAALAFS